MKSKIMAIVCLVLGFVLGNFVNPKAVHASGSASVEKVTFYGTSGRVNNVTGGNMVGMSCVQGENVSPDCYVLIQDR